MLFRIAALALAVCAFALPASAAGYPDHAIKMIVPFAAGGGTDVLARIIAQNLNKQMGPAGRGGKPAGRLGRDRHPGGDEGGARRLHLLMASTGALMAVSAGADGDGPFDVNKYLTPIVDRRGAALSAGGQPDPAGQLDRRSDPLCQDESRTD